MEADADTHNQALGQAQGVNLKRDRRDYKIKAEKPTETADLRYGSLRILD